MYTLLIVFYVLVSASLVGLVLIQQGKGADAGAAFGSGASGTVFGSRGSANFLSRATAWLATVFFALSLALAYVVHGRSAPGSVVDSLPAPGPAAAVVPAPQQPSATAPAAPSTQGGPVTDQPAKPKPEAGAQPAPAPAPKVPQ